MSNTTFYRAANQLRVMTDADGGTISASATSIALETDEGDKVNPLLLPMKFTYQPDPDDNDTYEIMHVTGVTGDTLTVTRAQEGTTGIAITQGSYLEQRNPAGEVNQFADALENGFESDGDFILSGSLRFNDNVQAIFGTDSDFNMAFESSTGLMKVNGPEELRLTRTTSVTNTAVPTLSIQATSTGDMADAFGPEIDFYVRDTAAVNNKLGSLRFYRIGGDNYGGATMYLASNGTPTQIFYSSADVFHFTRQLSCRQGTILSGISGSVRGNVTMYHGSGGNTPGYVTLNSKGGTPYYFWVTDAGVLRVHTSAPSADTDGSAV